MALNTFNILLLSLALLESFDFFVVVLFNKFHTFPLGIQQI